MNATRKYVDMLSDEDKIRIIQGYDQLEETGVIGDEPIRLHTMLLIEQLNMRPEHITMWMQQLAFECHRYFSMRYITEVYY